jgi:hypothetical protein
MNQHRSNRLDFSQASIRRLKHIKEEKYLFSLLWASAGGEAHLAPNNMTNK